MGIDIETNFCDTNFGIQDSFDYSNQMIDDHNVTHTFTDKPVMTQTEHFTAILADTSYSLANTGNTNDYSFERFDQRLQEYGNLFPIHQETISNLITLESNQDFNYLLDVRPIEFQGNVGHVCYTNIRGTEVHALHTGVRDIYNDAQILMGLIPRSSYNLNQTIPEMLSNHPECIYNIATGHSKAGHDLQFLNQHFDVVNTFEQGQTTWDIRNILNRYDVHDGSNITDFRVSCDPISQGVGPLNGNVVHLNADINGILNCHSMNNWIENVTIVPDEFNFQRYDESNYFTENIDYGDNMTHIPENFYDSNILEIDTTSNNLNDIQTTNDNSSESKTVEKSDNSLSEQNLTDTLTNLNQGLSIAQGISNFHNFTHNEKVLFIASTLIDTIKNKISGVFDNANGELNVFTNLVTSFLQNGKIKIEQLVMDICQNKFGVPLNGIKNMFDSILHHGKNMNESIKSLVKDCILYCVPYAQVVFMVFQSFQILKSFLTHKSVIEVGGFSVLRDEHSSFSFKRGSYHTVNLKNDVLDIDVTSRSKHTKDADVDAKAQFDAEARIKAYQVYGIDYDYFNDMKDNVPETRYDKYKEMLYFKLSKEYWEDINNLTDEEKKKYENAMFESDEKKTKRIKYEILGKKFSYFDTNGSKDIYHFVCDLKSDFLKCGNNTERAMFLYSLFNETGHSSDDQVHFSKFTQFVLELFKIDIVKFENYINFQNNISDKALDTQVKKQKDTDAKDNQDFLIQLRKNRTGSKNSSLTSFNTQQKNNKKNNEKQYSLPEIRKFAHIELLKYERSAEFVFQTIYSSVTSNLLFTFVYLDKEYLRIRNEGLNYIPSKTLEISGGCAQSYISTVIANHITLDLSLRERFLNVSDETFQYFVKPNILFLTSMAVSSIVKLTNKNVRNKNVGKQIFEIGENVLKTNGVNVINYYKAFDTDLIENVVSYVDNYLKLNFQNYSIYQDSLIALLKSYGFESTLTESLNYCLVGSSLSMTLTVMFATRIIKSLIFPEIKPKYVDVQNLKAIEMKNKETVRLVDDLSNNNVSQMKKKSIKRVLQLNGIMNYDKLPIVNNKIINIHSKYCGMDLIF
jgi:hypothetical protein